MIAKNKTLLLLIILIVALALGGWYTSKIPQFDTSKDFMITVLNGFWTAFFALIFLGISAIASKIFKRETQHYNSLVNLGTQLNEMIGVIKDNVYLMQGYKRSIVMGNIHWGNLRTIYVDKSHFENLQDIDLINRVFTFFYQVRKINDDMENLQNGYNELKSAFIQKQISVDHYVQNSKYIAEHLDDLEVFCEQLVDKLVSLLAQVRIQISNDKPITARITEALIYTSGKYITVLEYEKEKKTLEDELDMSSKESIKEIQKIEKRRKK